MLRLKHLVKYLLGTLEYCWCFYYQENPGTVVVGISDSDWAEDPRTRKSVSSGYITWGRHVLEHFCSGQQVVALSSGEAEFYACGKCAAHVLFLAFLFREIGYKQMRGQITTDSSAARGMLQRAGPGRVRHLHTRWLLSLIHI